MNAAVDVATGEEGGHVCMAYSPTESATESLLWSLRSDSSTQIGSLDHHDYCLQVFQLCDPEGKGYLTREGLVQLCDQPNFLDSIMETLDTNKNGRISYQEFEDGFKMFSQSSPDPDTATASPESSPRHHHSSTPHGGFLPDEVVFETHSVDGEGGVEWKRILERIDPEGMLKGTEAQRMWTRLSMEDPALLEHFEGFLADVVEELQHVHTEREKLESHVRRVRLQHSQEVNEMEEILQKEISEVRENQMAKSATQSKKLSTQFTDLLADRECMIQELSEREATLKRALQDKSTTEAQLRQERERLVSANQRLKARLNSSAPGRLSFPGSPRVAGRLTVSEGQEVEGDVEGQMEEGRRLEDSVQLVSESAESESEVHYFPPRGSPGHQPVDLVDFNGDDVLLCAPPLLPPSPHQTSREPFPGESEAEKGGGEEEEETGKMKEERLGPDGTEQTSVHSAPDEALHNPPSSSFVGDGYLTSGDSYVAPGSINSHTATSHIERLANQIPSYSTQVPRMEPHLDTSLSISSWMPRRNDLPQASSPANPSRVFKVIFLGNAGAGKTCLIQQLSEGQFSSSTVSTVGLDFTTTVLKIGGERVVFQLWDTAGQERFTNALTPVYFRRADAFVIVYDVTDQRSFKSTKSWVSIVTAALRERPTVVMVVGNKTDRPEKEREVTSEQGRKLALELQALFSEMSALSGDNVLQAHTTLGSLLLTRENGQLERAKKTAIKLAQEGGQRKSCRC